MDKGSIIAAIEALLKKELESARHASEDAASYATDEESRPESQWDTQGLEASYLAAGQATHAAKVQADLQRLRAEKADLMLPRNRAQAGAFVRCDLGGEVENFFISSVGGGDTVEVNGDAVTVITHAAPIAQSLIGHAAGDTFKLPSGLSVRIESVE